MILTSNVLEFQLKDVRFFVIFCRHIHTWGIWKGKSKYFAMETGMC